MSADLHPVMAAALAGHLAIPSMLAGAMVYRPAANRFREYRSEAEARTYDLAAECWPANLADVRPECAQASKDAWHDMERRAQGREDERADVAQRAREAGL